MRRNKLATLLASAEKNEQKALLKQYRNLADLKLAQNLKKLCYETWMSAPEKTERIVFAVNLLEKLTENEEVSAIADWIHGIGKLTNGEMKAALISLDKAADKFEKLEKIIDAAETKVSKLYALAVLGRYDEALECGLKAQKVFLENGEFLSAGKIEHNIGNIYRRQDRYAEAEAILRLARSRFSPEKNKHKLIQIENSLANALSHQHKFRESETIYRTALKLAEEAGLEVTQAEIESNLGYLSLFQGSYDQALKFFENSRRRYVSMQMPHQTAIAEQEIADAYLELNLIPEAEELYRRIIPTFSNLGMKAEKARALVYFARTLANSSGKYQEIHELLKESEILYEGENNPVGKAMVNFAEAQIYFRENELKKAESSAAKAEKIFKKAGAFGLVIQARLLRGNSRRRSGKLKNARKLLETSLFRAEKHKIPQAELASYSSLGLLEIAEKNSKLAEEYFLKAVELTEKLRAPLPAEDFRTAYITDKLLPFSELAGIYLAQNTETGIEKAFQFTERSRSRALLDLLGAEIEIVPDDENTRNLLAERENLREELNWFYRQLIDNLKRSKTDQKIINREIRMRESEISEIIRRIAALKTPGAQKFQPVEVKNLQNLLGKDSALIEYTSFNGEFWAFVITDEKISSVKLEVDEKNLDELLGQFRFQIDSMRKLPDQRFINDSTHRTRTVLQSLYLLLLKPLEKLVGFRRLIIIPHQQLNYVPFHALFDGFEYVIENREILYVPSAGVLEFCLREKSVNSEKTVIFGVADEKNPQVRAEVADLGELFSDAKVFLGSEATLKNLSDNSGKAKILHFACHGRFRADNPLYSSLELGDGFLTVRDAYKLDLQNCRLVVLSACETGISRIAKGEELLGLIRGFLSAGAPCLVLSLWQVEDKSTFELMKIFYRQLHLGIPPVAALRLAQIEILQKYPHPFFWSPFFAVGRWT